MPQPVTYNPGTPVSGSIQENSISYVVDGQNRNYRGGFGGLSWMSEVPAANNVIFIGNSVSLGRGPANIPLFYPSYNNSSANIVYAANTLPGSPRNFTTTGSAYNWAATNNFFINNSDNPIPRIDADGLVLYLNAFLPTSYPQTGTTWYDLSGYGNNATLYNGLNSNWNSNGWFSFDGVDDYAAINYNSNSMAAWTGSQTIIFWEYHTFNDGSRRNLWNQAYGGAGTWTHEGGTAVNYYYGNSGTDNSPYTALTSATTPTGRWNMLATTRDPSQVNWYQNSINTTNQSNPFGVLTLTTNNITIGNGYTGTPWVGNIGAIAAYNKALTQDEINQVYFQGNIVTGSLVFMVDANNLVSYPKSGTTWYQLTGSVNNGTLTNGPTFKTNNGGVISLDGADDFVDFGSANFQTSNNITLDMWVYPQSATQDAYADIFDASHSSNGFVLQQDYLTYNYYYFAYWDGSGFQVTSNIYIDPYVWSHIVITKEGNNGKIYKNGQLVVSNTFTNPSLQGTNTLYLGRFVPGGRQWKGEYGNFKGYNKALTPTEVQQNYQATKDKFLGQNIVTNGLVLNLDSANKDSYPGTGTTWYDLSGNGYNATVESNVSFNSSYGGGLTTLNNAINANQRIIGTFSLSSANYTWEIWYTNNGSQGGDASGFGVTDASGVSSNGFRANSDSSVQQWVGGSLTVGQTISTASTPKQVVLRRSGTTFNSFSNGVLIDTDIAASTSATFVNYSMNCNGCTASNNGWNGTYYIVRMYNRALSDAEITQNYNAQKTRFGL
jgi:hypothetical protein